MVIPKINDWCKEFSLLNMGRETPSQVKRWHRERNGNIEHSACRELVLKGGDRLDVCPELDTEVHISHKKKLYFYSIRCLEPFKDYIQGPDMDNNQYIGTWHEICPQWVLIKNFLPALCVATPLPLTTQGFKFRAQIFLKLELLLPPQTMLRDNLI